MLRAMGHEDVVVLDGGFPKWKAEHRRTEDLTPTPYPRHFTPRPNNALLRSFDQVKANIATKAEQVIDARGPARFLAREPEPRPGVRGGHVPGSTNMPYTAFTNPGGTLKSRQELAALFMEHGVDPARPVVTTCGSGVTASIALLALSVLGAKNTALYDGSWSEWGSRADAPIET
jgi:thiosulfate/3-mercaptopyruvate sulfurtransferase